MCVCVCVCVRTSYGTMSLQSNQKGVTYYGPLAQDDNKMIMIQGPFKYYETIFWH